MREAGLENEGGSLQPLVEAMEAAELTKARVYEIDGDSRDFANWTATQQYYEFGEFY